MTQALEVQAEEAQKPLNVRQLRFARELGIAIAAGGRDDDLVKAYARAGYAEDRGNARRLAADPRIRAIADEACAEALRLAGLHIGWLQGKALELLKASTTQMHRELAKLVIRDPETGDLLLRSDLSPEECARIDAVTWPISKLKIGDAVVELPDKKGIIEMLAKQLGVGKDDPGDVNVNVGLEALVVQSLQPAKEGAA